MDVDIKREEETRGMFRKTIHHRVTFKVQFTEEEKARIRQAGVEKDVLVELPGYPPGSMIRKTVQDVVKSGGFSSFLDSITEAQEIIEHGKTQLKALKTIIDATDAPKSEKFTL